ncbi:MAG: transcriptional regulator [Desulfurococcaceae archaeon]
MKMSLKSRVIELLRSHQGSYIPQSYIHRALGASKSRISEILRELEREGLISRISIGRTKIIYIHPQRGELEQEPLRRKLRLGVVYSSEYLFLGNFIKKLRDKGIEVEALIYRDGLEATIALAKGAIDLALSPLIGQLYMYPVYRTYRIVLSGLKGGFRVLGSRTRGEIYSSIISTMDYVRYYLISRNLVDASRTIYYRDPDQLITVLKRGGYVVTWHPVYLDLEKRGLKTIYTWRDLELDFCCTLGVSSTVGRKTSALIEKAYIDSIEEFKKNPDKGIEYYASLTGIDISILKSAISEYQVSEGIDTRTIDNLTEAFAFNVPSRSIFYEACKI